MYIKMHLQDDVFNKIKNGTKTIELRILDDKRRYLSKGDTILFINRNDDNNTFEADVLGVHIYPTFKELFENYSLSELGLDDIPNATYKIMEKYYPIQEQIENCVCGIEVKVKK